MTQGDPAGIGPEILLKLFGSEPAPAAWQPILVAERLATLDIVSHGRAEICTALDNSCLLHIGGGLSRQRAGVEAVHLAEILAATE